MKKNSWNFVYIKGTQYKTLFILTIFQILFFLIIDLLRDVIMIDFFPGDL